ncbi:DUF1850 domain-containing protein [Halalkalicoccus jeotgali]|uniref:DUF1850 domain-containing protein n=1 Tax=Halalkalicoccus jeotgali (strain DSM 18796 / CECT 7217 / JCM 14584 / KCTC 4019 / B3) TaxID=795797 RepID=D8J4V7_HALJB|nr:DUF1850 domain-containing protein [Halalkalicoccus jeotgali]ADJ15574.1 hypothetical protein HacjB3_10955 [Halalkalicoccus jeotgali B3]ELY36018.1 hypothetical protein C497_11717 [Halalkalicoccus jeotgali B3]
MRRRRVLSAIAGGLVLSPLAATDVTALRLADPQSGETLGVERVSTGDRFAIHYVHSFDKTPIHEVYEVRDEGIVQIREEFEYHAIGLEYTEGNQTREDGFTVLHMERELGSFTIRVAKYTDQSLVIDGESRPLSAYTEEWEPVRFSVERVSYLRYLEWRLQTL